MTVFRQNLRELLSSTIETPVLWIKNEPRADVAVNRVLVSLSDVEPGDILILMSRNLDSDILEQVCSKEPAVVIILGETQPELSVLDTNTHIANLPWNTEPEQVRILLQDFLLRKKAALMERGLQIQTKFSNLVAEGGGLTALVQEMSNLSRCGVLVQDKRGQIIADKPTDDLSGVWNVVMECLVALSSLPEPLLDRKGAGDHTQIFNQEIPGELHRLVSPITVGSVVRGYLSLVGTSQDFDNTARMVLEQGAVICAIEMARKKAVREAEKRLKGDLLTALLGENISPRDAELWIQTMGLDLEKVHVAVRFVWDGEKPPSRRRLETLVNGEISSSGLLAIVNPLGLEVICFCQQDSPTGRPETCLQLSQAVINQGKEEYPDHSVRCGVGAVAVDISEWRDSFRQAGQALSMARRFRGNQPYFFPDLSVYRLLLQIEHNPELITFHEETLGSLSAHEDCPEMVHTLESYFEHNTNVSKTAEALFIHRNTLLYRLEKIASILQLDLDNPENRLAVQLALRIQRMKGLC